MNVVVLYVVHSPFVFIRFLPKDSTAAIIVKMGPFSLDDPKDYSVDVRISDGGRPIQSSVTTLAIKVCLRLCVRGVVGGRGGRGLRCSVQFK